MIHRFADFELDVRSSTLRHRGERVDLPPKTIRMLAVLVEHAGNVVKKDELFEIVWPEGFVEESNLTQHVYLLRRVFAKHGLNGIIETHPRRGYSFHAPKSLAAASANRASSIRLVFASVLVVCLMVGTVPPSRAVDEVANTAYGLGRYYLNLRSVDAMKRSIAYFAAVVARSPDRASGYAGLADAYTMLVDFERPCPQCKEWGSAAERNARRAMALDRSSAAAHVSAGMVARIFHDDDETAANEFRTALSIDPNDALAHEWYGNLLVARGALDDARRELEIAAAQEPVATATYAWLARADYYARNYAEAERYARLALQLQPTRLETHIILGLVQEERGEYVGALSQFDAVARLGARIDAVVLRASVIGAMGERKKALTMLQKIQSRAAGDPYASRDMVLAYVAANDERDARTSLARVRYATPLDRRLFTQDPHVAALQPEPGDGRSN